MCCAHAGAESIARSGSFVLPPSLAALVDAGMELGDADDKVSRMRLWKRLLTLLLPRGPT